MFWASLALVLVTWGLVPVQAGIFSKRHISRSFLTGFNVSTSFIPASQQPNILTLRFAQSAYGIVVLNETLPPYMTREYTLAPFNLSSAAGIGLEKEEVGEWMAPTTMYGFDLQCEPAGWDEFNSSLSCTEFSTLGGNQTWGNRGISVKPIVGGSHWRVPFMGYYIDVCPPEKVHTFYAAISRNTDGTVDPLQNVTAISCEPFYYEQSVNATVDSRTKAPIQVVTTSTKRPLSADKFNTTWMLDLLEVGLVGVQARGDAFPDNFMPSWYDQMLDTGLSWPTNTNPMTSMAVAIENRPLPDYIDWRVLADAYQKAWGLLFARAMVDALGVEAATLDQVDGWRTVTTDAVVLEPIFTYIVEGLLGVVSIVASILLFISCTRRTALHSNPSTVASVMSLVAENEALLADFAGLDCCTSEQLHELVRARIYKLETDCQTARSVISF